MEGNSIRATVRMTGAAKNTVTKLLVDLGAACSEYQDAVLVDLPCKTIQCDEIWAYCYAKQMNVPEEHRGEYGYGDVWTWTALCADTKLVPTWLVGERTVDDAWTFMKDLESRLTNRVQLTTDGYGAYIAAVGLTFGHDIDWAQLQKIYGPEPAIAGARLANAQVEHVILRVVFDGIEAPVSELNLLHMRSVSFGPRLLA